MPFFAVIGFDHPPHSMALRDQFRPQHRAYVKGNDQQLRFAAAMLDGKGNQCGTVLFFEADSAQQVRQWTSEEPFCNSGVYKDLHIVQIHPGFNKIPTIDWPG